MIFLDIYGIINRQVGQICKFPKGANTMTNAVTETKRFRKASKRRIRWDRVFTCALITVFTFHAARGILNSNTRREQDAASTSSVSKEDEISCTTGINALVAETSTVTTTTEAPQITQKQIVVTGGFKLKLKASDESMGIEGIYFSKKLGRIISTREQKMLMLLVLSESAYEPHDAQVGVASTVLNRVLYEKMFPDNIEEVVTQPAQFSPVIMKNPENIYSKGYNGFYLQGGKVEVFWDDYPETVRNSVRQAVYEALDGTDPTECIGGALYYCNMNALSYDEYEYRKNIGEVKVFGLTTFYREWN